MTQGVQLVSIDIGGTHARFAHAAVTPDGAIVVDNPVILKTQDYASFQSAWQAFVERDERPPPTAASIAVAGPVRGGLIRFTNNPWVIRPDHLPTDLGTPDCLVINDFEALGHAVARADESFFTHLAGPDVELPPNGIITVLGPGTGLGVAQVWRSGLDHYRVQATEGGHVDFAPLDIFEDAILARLRKRHGRVSVERVVSGPAIVAIYETLAGIEGRAVPAMDDATIWQRGISGEDSLAVAALERFSRSLGAVAGDMALAHGANGVVVAGGVALRLQGSLAASGFANRFQAKGRFNTMLARTPVKLVTHPHPGLFGAAAAFAGKAITALT